MAAFQDNLLVRLALLRNCWLRLCARLCAKRSPPPPFSLPEMIVCSQLQAGKAFVAKTINELASTNEPHTNGRARLGSQCVAKPVRLHKWAIRQDENFLTETFAFLLEYLAENEPEAAAEFVSKISGGIITISPQHIRALEVRTQNSGDEGIPDIELRTGQHFVIIEVKCEAEATAGQLERYRRSLDASGLLSKGLILLTRYPASVEGADHYLRWYQLAEWIFQESSKYRFKAASQFLVEQFLGFLKARNMTMGQVTWEMTTGVRSLRNLVDMLYVAAAACGLKAQIAGDRGSMFVYLDGRKYWAGIRYASPEFMVFATWNAPADARKIEELGVGTTWQWVSDKTKVGWERDINLESEEVHFFARSKASQMQFLEQFLRENLELAQQVLAIDLSTQQVTPADPGGEES